MSVTSITRAVEVVTAFFDAYRAHDVERMVELCADNADFHYVPFEVWGKQRVIRGDGKVRTIGKVIWRTLIDSFPDLTNEVTSITSDDEGNVAVDPRPHHELDGRLDHGGDGVAGHDRARVVPA